MTGLAPFLTLAELDDTEVEHRIPDLLTTQGNVLISAYQKTGKTSLILHLVAALIDGGDFLGSLPCEPVDGRVVYINLELRQNMLRKYATDMGVSLSTRKLLIQDYCGHASHFTIADDEWREKYAKKLREVDARVLIIDPISPVLAMQGVDSNDNDMARVTLEMLGEIGADAGLDHLFIIDHTGHDDRKRARGASARGDWADVLWNVTAEDDSAYRNLRATGRDVSGGVRYLMKDKHLTVAGKPTNATGKPTAAGQVRDCLIKADGSWLSSSEIQVGTGLDQPRVSEVLTAMKDLGNVERKDKDGRGGGFLWRIPTKGF